MRIKHYTADTMAEALDLVRTELGERALIVSTQRNLGGPGVRITAAMDDDMADDVLSPARESAIDEVKAALVSHNAGNGAINRLLNRGNPCSGAYDFLLNALESTLEIAPLSDRQPRAYVLVGPPGAGKTLTVAKLAARMRIAGKRPALFTADCVKAGAVAQLQAFAEILDAPLARVRQPEELVRRLPDALKTYDAAFVDTPSFNPLDSAEVKSAAAWCGVPGLVKVAVVPAGADADEVADSIPVFKTLGVERIVVTRLDAARRVGAALVAGLAFPLAEFGVSGSVAGGLVDPSAKLLADMILPDSSPGPVSMEV